MRRDLPLRRQAGAVSVVIDPSICALCRCGLAVRGRAGRWPVPCVSTRISDVVQPHCRCSPTTRLADHQARQRCVVCTGGRRRAGRRATAWRWRRRCHPDLGSDQRHRHPSAPRRRRNRRPGGGDRPAAYRRQRAEHAGAAAAALADDGRLPDRARAQFQLQSRPRAGVATQSRARAHVGVGQRPSHGRACQQRGVGTRRGRQCNPRSDGGARGSAHRRCVVGIRLRCDRRGGQRHPQGQIRRIRCHRGLRAEHPWRCQSTHARAGNGARPGTAAG